MATQKTKRTRPGLRMTRMVIHRFRLVEPGSVLEFQPGMNVLIGKNATGKTTLLELISMALRADFSNIEEEDFKLTYELEYGVAAVSVTVDNSREDAAREGTRGWFRKKTNTKPAVIQVYVKYSDSTEFSRVRLENTEGTVEKPDSKNKFRFRGPIWYALQSVLEEAFAATMLPPGKRLDTEEIHALSTDFYDIWDNQLRFDEALEYFKLILDEDNEYDDAAECMISLKTPWFSSVPLELYEIIKKHFRLDANTSLKLSDGSLEFLHRIVRTLDLRGAELLADVTRDDPSKDTRIVGNFRFLFTLPSGARLPVKSLSFGQRRMFALLYYLAANRDMAIVDEPTNGLHHEWIEAFLEEIGDRQCFVATQHPLLLDYLTFNSAEEVRSTFVQCKLTSSGEKEQHWRWSSMSKAAAERFFKAYEAGAQYVSEILVSKGLW